ncbi:HNH endonuclease signature motif containing protein [Euzebya tangerina]|uniref:HNH endonuclease signature motif containing protein n=1 Tax=Euzebya tangerina TaxID=591198 RepID=UPI0013C363A9|nr:HNH endonuclease signature motif containing protein [Euzebya tangerina]
MSAVKGLRVAQIGELDAELAAEIGVGEPDRIVQRAYGWADVIAAADATVHEQDPGERRCFRVQPDLFGGAVYSGYDRLDAVTAIAEAAEAAADPPIKADAVGVDADGTPVPAELLPSTVRSAQLAEGLRRVAAAYLAGSPPPPATAAPAASPTSVTTSSLAASGPHTTGESDAPADALSGAASTRSGGPAAEVPVARPPRSSISIVIDHRELPSATGRALTRWYGGPIPLTRLTVDRLLCDPHLITVVTDTGRPIAVGDATSPITKAHYRTLHAVDRGCRLPGCTAPPQHCDAHHIIPRSRGGPTSVDNLTLLCRDCHSRVHTRGLELDLDRHTRAVTLTTPDGRSYTSLPA